MSTVQPRRRIRVAQIRREILIEFALRACAFSAVAGLVLIVVFVFKEAWPVLFDPETQKEASLQGFFATPRE